MAKINHNNYLDVVDSVWTSAKQKGIMHINSEEQSFNGEKFTIKGRDLINFGTCGYLGLETHPDLIAHSIELTKKFGTQLSMSRAYIRPTYIQELEELMSQIFDGNKVICYTSTSNAHISVIATIIKSDDLIILDQQVHFSVQFPCKNTKLQGTEVKMVRHSNYEMLEEMIKENYNKYKRIWYMADGVYSMHGDLPDTVILKNLLDKYPKLHLYFDDAHGMGWDGKNGAGYIYDRLGVSERIVIISTLAKGFGCVGGTAIFSDPEMYRRTDIFGGPLSYSHPLSPANVGAAIASAKIHLSKDIYNYQSELKELMQYMNRRLKEKNLTNISSPDSPIYFIGSGLNKVTRNFVHRVLREGIYVNTATFPVVPNDRSGLRFTLTRHNTKADIDLLTDVMAYHLPKAIEEEGDNIERVYGEFGCYLPKNENNLAVNLINNSNLIIEEYTTIHDVNAEEWDFMFKDRGNITHLAMQAMEEIFSNNEKLEENWSFHYIIIKDKEGKLVLSTFFTGAIYKDDIVSPENVSKQIEEARKNDPYYLCSKTLAMGSLFCEGDLIYQDTEHPEWRKSINHLFDFVSKVKKEIDATVVIFRDFEEDSPLNQIIEEEGFAKMRMPNTNIVSHPKWDTKEELLALLNSKNSISNIKRYVFKYEDQFNVTIKKTLTEDEAEKHYQLFLNIKKANHAFNFFAYPEKTAKILSKYDNWEFIEFRLKDSDELIGCIWFFIGDNHASPLIVGLNYDYVISHHLYKQVMYYMVKRGNDLGKAKTYLGLTSDYEKKKYGAKSIALFGYIKVDNMYNLDLLSSLSN
ncbi:aminotransferase class I/II-fold pyridoxal phosphate-dependent enzyme [Flavobacterium seoulense]|uniref:7-keto-8-aminopelargonate synthetase-like enzyme n=1 Tax=Flavobacterium seoulense TaxID=1492738 RepID=A0A066WTE7_9FLAO|nr:aminotransferase class I/II-fold pyridoxal phosphate-dependent enzyme [Flavobacterium seoulense]KDN54259.1 7-keto-8-aminopelargonate synthetase-like enzyme [Flavobacterium seoulense]